MNVYQFFQGSYRDNAQRKKGQRHLRGDLLLYAKNSALRPLERVLTTRYAAPEFPVVFIVGAPRSGTTLLYQLIARHLNAGYVNNFMARYWMAPLYGAMRYRRQFGRASKDFALRSHYGATEGPHSPHEFGWFFQYFCGFSETDDWAEDGLDLVRWDAIRRELFGLAGWFEKPLVMKNLNYVDYQIPRFASELPNSLYLSIERDPRYVVQSILEVRKARYGDERTWWSMRPRDVGAWMDRDPVEQVCHQVADITHAVEEGLGVLDAKRVLRLRYETLLDQPERELARVARFIGGDDADVLSVPNRADLGAGNRKRADDERFGHIERVLAERGLFNA